MSVSVFFGSSKISENDDLYSQTLRLSETVSSLGYDIASGGYGGVMEAALKGAVNSGVKRIGVTCEIFKDRIPNDFLSDEIKTKDYIERLEILIDVGDLFIAVQGESGTLLEVSAVIALIERQLIENRYLILVGSLWIDLSNLMDFAKKIDNIYFADDVNSAVEFIKSIKIK
ncbi:MAG: LOG family protein [Candidatus Kapabacteria bacterium]|nr:LOG family protein [Candidatus Kapabacteria bacterium]